MFNKKAMVDDLADFLFLVLIASFSLFFLSGVLHNNIKQSEANSVEQIDDTNAMHLFLLYLETPIGHAGATVADLMVLAQRSPEAQSQLKTVTEEFAKIANTELFQGIRIEYPSQIIVPLNFNSNAVSRYTTITLYSSDGKEIKVMLYGKVKASDQEFANAASLGPGAG